MVLIVRRGYLPGFSLISLCSPWGTTNRPNRWSFALFFFNAEESRYPSFAVDKVHACILTSGVGYCTRIIDSRSNNDSDARADMGAAVMADMVRYFFGTGTSQASEPMHGEFDVPETIPRYEVSCRRLQQLLGARLPPDGRVLFHIDEHRMLFPDETIRTSGEARTVFWYSVLVQCSGTVFWYSVLVRCSGTVFWYSV